MLSMYKNKSVQQTQDSTYKSFIKDPHENPHYKYVQYFANVFDILDTVVIPQPLDDTNPEPRF